MTAREALDDILDDLCVAVEGDAVEIIEELEKRGFKIVEFTRTAARDSY